MKHARIKSSGRHVRGGPVTALLAIACVAWLAGAQPPSEPPAGGEPGEGRRTPMLDREAFRARLSRRLDDMRAMLARLEAAVEKLDAGAPLPEILAELADDTPPMARPEGPRPGQRRSGPRPPEVGPEHRPPGPVPHEPAARATRVREFVRRHLPALLEEFSRPDGEPVSERLVAWLAPQIADLESARQRDDELFKARLDEIRASVEVGRRLRELRRAAERPGATPESLREYGERIREALGAQFDARMRAQRREIELLLQRVERLKADTDRQQAQRERLLDERLAEIEAMTRQRRDDPLPMDRP